MVLELGGFVTRALRNLGVPERELDDCVQRVYIVADRRLDDIRLGCEKAFLFRSASHIALHARRSLGRKRETFQEEPFVSGEVERPDVLTERKQLRELLDQILDTMSEDVRQVFVLHSFEEMTMREISEVLAIPSGTVASRLRRARLIFRRQIQAQGGLVEQESA
jgi:RNA polymerase sigma-70 factor (ECF subfamily)